MKTVYIHIGAPKSGSTALQAFLVSVRDMLTEASVFYDPADKKLGVALFESCPLTTSELESLRKYVYDKYFNLKEKIVIISSESLLGDHHRCFENAELIANTLKYIFEGFTVKICAFVRRQDTFLESLYAQMVKAGRVYKDFTDFQRRLDIYGYEWPNCLEKYEKKFGLDNLTVLPYEEFKKNNAKILKLFFNPIGINIDLGKNFRIPSQNVGFSDKAVEIAKACNPIVMSDNERRALKLFLRKTFPKPKGTPYRFFADFERQRLLSRYVQSNEMLFKKYIKGLPEYYRYYVAHRMPRFQEYFNN